MKYRKRAFIFHYGVLFIRDHDGIWTHTPFRAPAPQAGKSTVSPRGLKKERSFEKRTTFCDPTGARTQDPIIKSDVLYQLSYRVDAFKKNKSICDPTGARTQDPIIKSDVLYQLSYRVFFFPWMRVQI